MTSYQNTWRHNCKFKPLTHFHSFNKKWSTCSQPSCVFLQSSWSSSRRTAMSRAGGRTYPLTLETLTQLSCSWPPLSTTSSGLLPSTQWGRVSPASPHYDTRPVELVRSTTHTNVFGLKLISFHLFFYYLASTDLSGKIKFCSSSLLIKLQTTLTKTVFKNDMLWNSLHEYIWSVDVWFGNKTVLVFQNKEENIF